MYLIGCKGGVGMYSGKHDVIVEAVQKEVAGLDPAELVLVADYIRGIKLARKFRK